MLRTLLVAAVLALVVFFLWRNAIRNAGERVYDTAATALAEAKGTPTPTPVPVPPLPPNPQGLARWDTVPVHFCISPDGAGYVTPAQFLDAVVRAFNAWGIEWKSDGACAGPVVPNDGRSEIGWGRLPANSGGGAGDYEAGLTQTVTQQCTANCDPNDYVHLSEADITIDPQPPSEYRTARCLYSTMLHEVGHFLGLQHLPSPAIMAARTSGCPTELTAADRQALRVRYGARAP